ncbi:magnesium ion-transporting ATPase E1-E2 family protein [Xenorhabdus vietnamensis]|uniref:Magnesium ion-transporting ATPase E1-E2 family protein n=1 Tax=Xenorhabdus vietnamensis TaxID=351656 RepID=A0A1Y2SG70_9GAMM|nr:hypothetical protein [Xenorhabdus vietnamensis]OTA17352.1 magnesium ion-transporting ATPase E1-E2 family protein [Xenorhabdus vietnamensis]
MIGFLEDGINDKPALWDAGVGILVNIGTNIAKEVADLILFEKNLMVLGRELRKVKRLGISSSI